MTLQEGIDILQQMIKDGVSPNTPLVVGENAVDVSYDIFEIRFEKDLDIKNRFNTEEVVIDHY